MHKNSYQIVLTQEEANTLLVLTGNVSGSREHSPRKHADSVHKRLIDMVGTYGYLTLEGKLLNTTADFDDYPVQEDSKKNTLTLKAEIDFSDAKKDIEELTELLKQVEVIKNRIFKEV